MHFLRCGTFNLKTLNGKKNISFKNLNNEISGVRSIAFQRILLRVDHKCFDQSKHLNRGY
jgi:hypothetical protein